MIRHAGAHNGEEKLQKMVLVLTEITYANTFYFMPLIQNNKPICYEMSHWCGLSLTLCVYPLYIHPFPCSFILGPSQNCNAAAISLKTQVTMQPQFKRSAVWYSNMQIICPASLRYL